MSKESNCSPADSYVIKMDKKPINDPSIRQKLPKKIDACTFSPDGKHLATYSALEGIITVYKADKLMNRKWQSDEIALKPRGYLEERISFNPSSTATQMMTNVDFALSNGGNYSCL